MTQIELPAQPAKLEERTAFVRGAGESHRLTIPGYTPSRSR
jgi:hypothetical protein